MPPKVNRYPSNSTESLLFDLDFPKIKPKPKRRSHAKAKALKYSKPSIFDMSSSDPLPLPKLRTVPPKLRGGLDLNSSSSSDLPKLRGGLLRGGLDLPSSSDLPKLRGGILRGGLDLTSSSDLPKLRGGLDSKSKLDGGIDEWILRGGLDSSSEPKPISKLRSKPIPTPQKGAGSKKGMKGGLEASSSTSTPADSFDWDSYDWDDDSDISDSDTSSSSPSSPSSESDSSSGDSTTMTAAILATQKKQ